MQLTKFTEKDYATLINWISSEKLNYLWSGPLYTYPLTNEQIENHCNQTTVYPYLFSVSGKSVGYVELCQENETSFRICRVFIADNFKGKGYSKPMLALLIDLARTHFAAITISLAVFEHNVVALNLYTSLGLKLFRKRCLSYQATVRYGNWKKWKKSYNNRGLINRECRRQNPGLTAQYVDVVPLLVLMP